MIVFTVDILIFSQSALTVPFSNKQTMFFFWCFGADRKKKGRDLFVDMEEGDLEEEQPVETTCWDCRPTCTGDRILLQLESNGAKLDKVIDHLQGNGEKLDKVIDNLQGNGAKLDKVIEKLDKVMEHRDDTLPSND